MDLSGNMPLILAGGGILGLVLLVTKSSTANEQVQGTANAVSPAVLGAGVQMNTVAMGTQVDLAAIQEKLSEAQFSADVSKQAQLYGYLTNADNNSAMVENTRVTTNAGITSAIIASGTAIAVDQSNNATRLNMAYVQSNTSIALGKDQVKIAKVQAKAQKTSSIASAIGGAIGSVTKIATAAM